MTATLDEGLFDYLTHRAGLAALIGTRIHPDYFSEDEDLPQFAYSSRTTAPRTRNKGRRRCARQFTDSDIWADTAAEAVAVMKQLCAALDGYRGSSSRTSPIVGVFFDGAGRSRTQHADIQRFNAISRFITRRNWT